RLCAMSAASSQTPISTRSEVNDQPRRPTLRPCDGALTACRMEELGIEPRVAAEQLRTADADQHLRQLFRRARLGIRPGCWDAGAIIRLYGSELGVVLGLHQ